MTLESSHAVQRIEDAIVIHGPGRSGTTLLNQVLSCHPSLGWVSGWIDRFPELPQLALTHRLVDPPAVERFARGRRYWPRSAEPYGFWNHYFPGFSSAPRSAEAFAHDRPRECADAIRSLLRWSGKSRFLTKITGAPRRHELEQVLDRPWVVYIHRDPRAVVASYLKQRWGYKRRPEEMARRSEQELLDEHAERYLLSWHGRRELEGPRLIEIEYEQLVADPVTGFADLSRRLELPDSARFRLLVRSWRFRRGTNQAWREQLQPASIAFLERRLAEPLDRFRALDLPA